jgi:hypothetical protein
MDSSLANNPNFSPNQSAYLFGKYWAKEEQERRKRLLPFYSTQVLPKARSIATGILAMR